MYHVYLVDDEVLMLKDLCGNLPWLEYNMHVAGATEEPAVALDEIIALKPDVVFTDVQMPGMTGLELIEAAQKRGATCKFVVVSAYDSFDYARQLIRLNGFDYLIKPVEERQYTETLSRLLLRMEKEHPDKELPVVRSEELSAILEYLEANLHKKQTLGALSRRFGLNPNHICSLFSKHLSSTFSTYLTRQRMARAGEALQKTQRPMKDIAAACGYNDYFYFCRVFRDYYKCTPTQYRRGAE